MTVAIFIIIDSMPRFQETMILEFLGGGGRLRDLPKVGECGDTNEEVGTPDGRGDAENPHGR